MEFKVGDKVKYVSGNFGRNNSNPRDVKGTITEFRDYQTFKIEVDRDNGEHNNYKATDLELVKAETVSKRYTYRKTYTRNDGVVFEKDSINGRNIKRIEEGIKNHKEDIKNDELLLRTHRALKF